MCIECMCSWLLGNTQLNCSQHNSHLRAVSLIHIISEEFNLVPTMGLFSPHFSSNVDLNFNLCRVRESNQVNIPIHIRHNIYIYIYVYSTQRRSLCGKRMNWCCFSYSFFFLYLWNRALSPQPQSSIRLTFTEVKPKAIEMGN